VKEQVYEPRWREGARVEYKNAWRASEPNAVRFETRIEGRVTETVHGR